MSEVIKIAKPDIKSVLKHFNVDNDGDAYGNGHINETYIVQPMFIVQKINTNVFTKPDDLMNNIVNVTEFLKKKIIADGGDPMRETLTVIPTNEGHSYYKSSDGSCYRCYEFIRDSLAIETVENPEDLYEAAKSFALFQKRLSDYPAEELAETIKDFHNTPKRFENLLQAIENDEKGRKASVRDEIEFALAQKDWIDTVTNGLGDGSIPLRVTHNDTKINNVLFDYKTRKGLCVIDLDTVMPGSLLYDIGDALRIGAATGAEDETDLDKIWFNLESFEAFVRGFAEESKDTLTAKEIELIPISAMLMTYECGIRFLTDYLNGDTYFRIHREHHNLDRCRTQFKLVKDMFTKSDEMKKIVDKYFN